LTENAENVAHGLSQAFQKRGLPRSALSHNGAAMTAAEIVEGLLNELAETAELISDDAAIESLGDRTGYAEILLDVARSAHPISAGIAMARTVAL
jgi:hypothetical protein